MPERRAGNNAARADQWYCRLQTQCEDSHQLGVLGTPFEAPWRVQLQRHPIDVQLKVQPFARPQASGVRDRSLAEL